jgi:ABC-2 type transport system ATP-binding protein
LLKPLVRLLRLRKRYDRKTALDGVDLVLDRREIVGVVGPDGAGKTTLIRSLAGLLEIEADEALVLGHDLRGDVTALKSEIGYVPQSFGLHRELSVIENLRFTARLHRMDAEEFRRRSGSLLERTGLRPFTDRAAAALSGGMKQKLAVANALLPAPALLLLDEPTAGVDVVARGEIGSLLEEAKRDALVVFSTSYVDEAARVDRLLYLDDGRLVAQGTPEELRQRVPVDLYHLWGDGPREIARAARALRWVEDSRATGAFARVEVGRALAPEKLRVLRELHALPGVRLATEAPIDMESTLLALARGETPAGAA